jgi:hypothetical protein
VFYVDCALIDCFEGVAERAKRGMYEAEEEVGEGVKKVRLGV